MSQRGTGEGEWPGQLIFSTIHTQIHTDIHKQASHMWRQAGCCLWRGLASSNCPMHAWVMSARLWKDSFPVIHTHTQHPYRTQSLFTQTHTNLPRLFTTFSNKYMHTHTHTPTVACKTHTDSNFLPLFFSLTHTQTHIWQDVRGEKGAERQHRD